MAITPPGHTVFVSGVDRASIRGSFLISAFATVDGKREYIGTDAVLSRWHVEGCMNCQNHLEATASFKLAPDSKHLLAAAAGNIEVEVRTRQGLLGGRPRSPRMATLTATAAHEVVPFKVEIR
jgi:tyrosinase